MAARSDGTGLPRITLRYFAGAAAAASAPGDVVAAATLGEALAQARARHDDKFTSVLSICSLLRDGARVSDPVLPLADGDTLDVLPPFAGG